MRVHIFERELGPPTCSNSARGLFFADVLGGGRQLWAANPRHCGPSPGASALDHATGRCFWRPGTAKRTKAAKHQKPRGRKTKVRSTMANSKTPMAGDNGKARYQNKQKMAKEHVAPRQAWTSDLEVNGRTLYQAQPAMPKVKAQRPHANEICS